jgi:glucose/arabinose dehydrogenase/cytochrome c5
MIRTSLLRALVYFVSALALSYQVVSCSSDSKAEVPDWEAPRSAKDLKEPFTFDDAVLVKGKQTYNLYCATCHGETGFGNGPARGARGDKPANFHRDKFRHQVNGEIFWKLTNGRKDMPAFEKILTEEQRWQLVHYLRNIPERGELKPPVALRPDIQVEHFMKIDSLAVRILVHPKTGDIWYTTFGGDVFRIANNNGQKSQEKILSVADHGIHTLQGAAFLDNTLFLCGNVYPDNKKTTHGRMVRAELDSAAGRKIAVVFNTVNYPANKTIYDHGWNALEISPDKKYIYINSGARTDHGEIQDNGGEFPNARDNALTSKIFRLPVDARDLLLPDDEKKLREEGYLFASGIRNAYDMSFDPEGQLFCVVNSADYDFPEDMFWVREGHHYGFPWVMGGVENPQQYAGWKPDPATDAFINEASHSWRTKYYYSDTGFPKRPDSIRFSPGVQNLGPDANEYRGHSGKVQDGDQTGLAVSTFTAHCCPLGLFFDTKKILSGDLKGNGFVLRFTSGANSGLMRPFTTQGSDMLQLQMEYNKLTDNYFTKTNRIVDGFHDPVDAIMIGSDVYVIEYGGREGHIWKISLPADTKSSKTK